MSQTPLYYEFNLKTKWRTTNAQLNSTKSTQWITKL